MKRASQLFGAIYERSNIAHAVTSAAAGKRHRPEVAAFLDSFEEHSIDIATRLRDGTYQFGPYHSFKVRDPKSRLIHAPTFGDRVVHHALIRVTGPVFESSAIDHSYACRVGKGCHAALRQASKWIHHNDWFLKIDIRKYYDTIDHALIKAMLRRRFAEGKLLATFDRLLESYCKTPGKGLPIGALTSQYLGNFLLDTVDRWVKQTMGVRRYLRYMDDMLCVGEQTQMLMVLRELPVFLETLGLHISPSRQLNSCPLGVPWLGFVIYPNRIRLNAQGRRRLLRRTRLYEKLLTAGNISELELQQRVTSMFAHAAHADDIRWRHRICFGTVLPGFT